MLPHVQTVIVSADQRLLRSKYDILQCFPPLQPRDVVGDHLLAAANGAIGPATHVRGHHDVRQRVEWQGCGLRRRGIRRRIDIPCIDNRAADAFADERIIERTLVDDRTTTDVDDDSIGPHCGERRLINDAPRRLKQWQ